MRGLNLLSKQHHHGAWERFQYDAVACELRKVLLREQQDEQQSLQLNAVPLFPGAMMFNQILVFKSTCDGAVENNYSPEDMRLPEMADSFDSYYQSFSRVVVENKLSGSIVIDCGRGTQPLSAVSAAENPVSDPLLTQSQMTQLERQVDLLCSQNQRIDTLVFLQKESYRRFRESYNGPLNVRLHQPDWHVFSELLYLYRCSAHVLFVNSLRVLDAAYSACRCSILIDDAVDPLRYRALLCCLEKNTYCQLLLQPEKRSTNGSAIVEDNIDRILCDNNQQALAAAISSLIHNTPAKCAGEDFIEYFDSAPADNSNRTVINSSAFITSTLRARLVNRRIKLLRKINKLREDPKSFCRDSSNVLIRSIGSAIPDKKVANG